MTNHSTDSLKTLVSIKWIWWQGRDQREHIESSLPLLNYSQWIVHNSKCLSI